jgi:hypothetical protein
MLPLTSSEALVLTANFALTADRMRAGDSACDLRVRLCETASRIAFLRAQLLAKSEEVQPVFGGLFRRAAFAIA